MRLMRTHCAILRLTDLLLVSLLEAVALIDEGLGVRVDVMSVADVGLKLALALLGSTKLLVLLRVTGALVSVCTVLLKLAPVLSILLTGIRRNSNIVL